MADEEAQLVSVEPSDAWKEWVEGELGRLRDALGVIGTVATLAAHPVLPTQDS